MSAKVYRAVVVHLVELHRSLILEGEDRGSVEDDMTSGGSSSKSEVRANVLGDLVLLGDLLGPQDVRVYQADGFVKILSLPGVLFDGIPAVQIVGHHSHGVRVTIGVRGGVVSLAVLRTRGHIAVCHHLGLGSLQPAGIVIGPAHLCCLF